MATAARDLVPAKGRRVDGRRNNRGTVGNKGGRPEWKPTTQRIPVEGRPGVWKEETPEEAMERTRQVVQHYTAIGYPREVICNLVKPSCDEDTLSKHFEHELKYGRLAADARMAGTAYQLGVTGRDPGMTRFWLRARMGWRDHGDKPSSGLDVQFTKIEGDDW